MTHTPFTGPRKVRGSTLIELMIAVVVISILAAIALPAYNDYVTRSRRSDGRAALSDLATAQETFRSKCPGYASAFGATCGVDLNGDNDALDVNENIAFLGTSNSPDGYYTVTISAGTATGFTAHATPQGAQAGDTACDSAAEFAINQDGPVEGSAAQRLCWGK